MSGIQRTFRLFAFIAVSTALTLSTLTAEAAKKAAHPAPWVGKDFHGKKCTNPQIGFGPFDYLNRHRLAEQLDVVEEFHFDAGVENLVRGLTSTPMDDINYTLSAWPNHHRALNSAITYRLRHRKWPKQSKGKPAECYLQRAIKYSPNDGVSHMLYGLLQHRFKRYPGALKSYRRASQILPDDIVIRYNTGLVLVDMKRFKPASEVATEVYELGFPLPGLKKKLVIAGWWDAQEDKPIVPEKTPGKKESGAGVDEAATAEAVAGEPAPDSAPGLDADSSSTEAKAATDNEPVEPQETAATPGESDLTSQQPAEANQKEAGPVPEPEEAATQATDSAESAAADERVEPAVAGQ